MNSSFINFFSAEEAGEVAQRPPCRACKFKARILKLKNAKFLEFLKSPKCWHVVSSLFCIVLAVVTLLLLDKNFINCKLRDLDCDEITENEEFLNEIQSVELLTNEPAHPCDNFYHFACHHWNQENPRPDSDDGEWNAEEVLRGQIQNNILSLLEQPAEEDDNPAFKQAQQFYDNCRGFQAEGKKASLETALGIVWNTYELYSGENIVSDSTHPGNTPCEYFVKHVFKMALGNKYLKSLYSQTYLQDILEEANTMSKNIKNAAKGMLHQGGWSPNYQTAIDNVEICQGFPEWIFNDTRVQEEYNGLALNQSTFPEHFLQAHLWTLAKNIERLEYPDSEDFTECDWKTFPGGAFSHFEGSREQIYIPMGDILRSYSGSENAQSVAETYGSLGYVIGHELSHALYALGWQTHHQNLTLTEECLVEQYSKFTVDEILEEGLFLDGSVTLEENLADIAGLKLSYYAYKQLPWKPETEETENFSDDQQLFLGFAERYCESYTLEGLKESMQRSHSPGIFRVLGTLQNFEEFAKAWDCPVGSFMNPHRKCYVF